MVALWVDSQGSSLEELELGPAEACCLDPEDPGFWIPCIFESLAAQPMTYRLASSHKSSGGGELTVSSLLPAGLPSPSIMGGLPSSFSPFSFCPIHKLPSLEHLTPGHGLGYRCHLLGNTEEKKTRSIRGLLR